jgi:hypothetical protein
LSTKKLFNQWIYFTDKAISDGYIDSAQKFLTDLKNELHEPLFFLTLLESKLMIANWLKKEESEREGFFKKGIKLLDKTISKTDPAEITSQAYFNLGRWYMKI